MGVRDRDSNVYVMLPYRNALIFAYCHHPPTDRGFYHGLLESAVERYYMLHKTAQGITVDTVTLSKMKNETFLPANQGLAVVGAVWGREFAEGDTVGVAVDTDSRNCAFFMQGQLIGASHFSLKKQALRPCQSWNSHALQLTDAAHLLRSCYPDQKCIIVATLFTRHSPFQFECRAEAFYA